MIKKLLSVWFLILLLFSPASGYMTKTDYVRGTISTLFEAGTGHLYVEMTTNANNFANSSTNISIRDASCSNYTVCANREQISISGASCAGTPVICDLTVTARNQGGTSHSGSWAVGSVVDLLLIADMSNEITAAIDGKSSPSSSDTFTNKTFDASATGNILKMKGYIGFPAPHYADNVSAITQTVASSKYFGQVLFANNIDYQSNWTKYRWFVPDDIDTTVDLTLRYSFTPSASETSITQRYIMRMCTFASGNADCTEGTAVNLDYSGNTTANNERILTDTLTGWASALSGTAGYNWIISIGRDGDDGTYDSSVQNSYSGRLVITYGKTQ